MNRKMLYKKYSHKCQSFQNDTFWKKYAPYRFIMILMNLELHFHKKRVFFVKPIDVLNFWNVFQIYNIILSIITQFLIFQFHVIVFWKLQIINADYKLLFQNALKFSHFQYDTFTINKSPYDISYMVLNFYMHNKFTIIIKSIFYYFHSSQNILATQHSKYILCLTEAIKIWIKRCYRNKINFKYRLMTNS